MPAPDFSRLDLRLILGIPARQSAVWVAMVLAATWAGYPGVICITPLAWLIALRVGLEYARQSTSPQAGQRLLEAALAGAWFGLITGVMFWIMTPLLGPVQPDERVSMVLIDLGMLAAGVLAGAGLSVFTAALADRRRMTAGE